MNRITLNRPESQILGTDIRAIASIIIDKFTQKEYITSGTFFCKQAYYKAVIGENMAEREVSSQRTLVEIKLTPLEENLEDIAELEAISDILKSEIASSQQYEIRDKTTNEAGDVYRSGSVIFQLFSSVVQTIHDQHDIITYLTGTSVTVLALILKQRRVKKVELKCGKKTLLIENADQHAIQHYLQQFQTFTQEATTEHPNNTKIEMQAFVSHNHKNTSSTQKETK